MAKQENNNLIIWAAVIVLIILVVPKLPLITSGKFAIVTTLVCSPGITNYYSLDGNLVDQKSNMNAVNNGVEFTTGKINQGLSFNGTNYISFPTLQNNLSVGYWAKEGSSEWTYLTFLNTNNLNSTFGKGFIGIIDEISVGNNISGLSNIQSCYTTTQNINVSCNDYATANIADNSSGSLGYNGTFYPDCSYSWKPAQYSITNNLCSKNFLYSDTCLISNNCYSDISTCTQNLKYDCFVLNSNTCTEKTDYNSCTLTTSNMNYTYTTQSACNTNIVVSTNSVVNPTPQETSSISDFATKEIWNIGGFVITPIHLLLALILVFGIIYLISKK